MYSDNALEVANEIHSKCFSCRFFTDHATRKENGDLIKKKMRAQSPASSLRSNTPTG